MFGERIAVAVSDDVSWVEEDLLKIES